MPRIIVERTFDSALAEEDLRAVEQRMAPCLELYDVRWIRSYWSGDHRRMICEYEAADVASVRKVQREAEASFEKIWAAEILGEP
jgi:hypothetical protein